MDDNKNLILATVLSFLVVLVWYTVFAPTEAPAPPPTEIAQAAPGPATAAQPLAGQTTAPGQTTAAPVLPEGTATATAAAPAAGSVAAAIAAAPRLAIDTPKLAGSVSLLGGRIDDLQLKDYHETLDKASPLVRLLAPVGGSDVNAPKPYYAVYGWLPAGNLDPALLPGATTLWSQEAGDVLAPGKPIRLVWNNGAGLIFHREIAIDDHYLFTVKQSVENQSGAPVRLAPYGIVARHGQPQTQGYYVLHEGVVGMTDKTLHELKYKDMAKLDPIDREGQAEVTQVAENGWIGFTDKYWMTTLAPMPGQPFTSVVRYAAQGDIYQAEARLPVMEVAPGAQAEVSTHLFAGAKEFEVIESYQNQTGIVKFLDSIDWGWFYFLTKPMFRLLHWLHGMIGNMGWAIIALTFVIKALVFPLARKSYVSMAKMKELQPEMEKLKERTGDDKAAYQKGMMELYKKEKVNPAAGCLPILVQIPIFFSLYKVIFVTLELRHAPWLGWIRDLSAPDPSSILNLFGLLPWATPAPGTPFAFLSLGLLPILLGISMWFQQKLNPTPADPAQKMIFAWMPWIFMFMLGGFASGLVLYWITNNTITFAQQYGIMTMHGHRPDLFGNIRQSFKRPAKGAPKPPGKAPKA